MAIQNTMACAQVTLTDLTDADALVEWYRVTASGTAPDAPTTTDPSATPSGWSRSEPTVSTDADLARYAWRCVQVVWGDGTCEWGTVTLSSSYEAAKVAYNRAVAASRTATSYVTEVGTGGIKIHPEGDADDYALIDGTGMEVFDGGTSVAKFGETARVGQADKQRVAVTENTVSIYDANNALAVKTNTDGVTLYRGGSKRSELTAAGLDVFGSDGSTSIASFGATSRVGTASGARVVTTSTGVDIYNSSNQKKASYGSTQYIYGGNGTYPYVMINGTGSYMYQSANNHADVTSSGLEVFQGGNSTALFGSSARIGKSNDMHVNVSSSGMTISDGSSNNIMNITAETGTTARNNWRAAEMTFGSERSVIRGSLTSSDDSTYYSLIDICSGETVGGTSYGKGVVKIAAHNGAQIYGTFITASYNDLNVYVAGTDGNANQIIMTPTTVSISKPAYWRQALGLVPSDVLSDSNAVTVVPGNATLTHAYIRYMAGVATFWFRGKTSQAIPAGGTLNICNIKNSAYYPPHDMRVDMSIFGMTGILRSAYLDGLFIVGNSTGASIASGTDFWCTCTYVL